MAHILDVEAQNFETIAESVGQYLAALDTQPELLQFPTTIAKVLQDVTWTLQYCLGIPSVRQAAFVLRMPSMMVHFSEIEFVFTDNLAGPSGGLVPLVKQIVLAHFSPAQDPFSVETFRELEPRVAETNLHLRLAADQPTSVSGKVLWHEQHKHRLTTALKEASKQSATNASSKVLGVQSSEFRDVSPIILASSCSATKCQF